MPLILLSIVLLPLPLALSSRFNRRFEEVLPLCWGSLAAGAYLLGLLNLLSLSRWLLLGLTAASICYLLWQLWSHRTSLKDYLCSLSSPGLWIFLILMAVLWWICRGRQYINWDEYSHWGRAIKAMVTQNVLPAVAAGKDLYREYPCGPALFQYLGMSAAGIGFRPDVSIFLQDLFALSFLLYPLRWIDKKEKAASCIAGFSLFFAPLIVYYNFYMETTVDGLLGVLFAVLMLGWTLGRSDKADIAFLTLTAFTLSLTKSSGLAFLVMAMVVAAVSGLVRRKKSGLSWRQLLLSLALPLAGGLAGKYSWNAFLNAHDVSRRWAPSDLSWETLLALFRGEPQWRADTVDYFCWNIFSDHNYGSLIHMPYAALMAVTFILAAVLFVLIRKPQRSRWAAPLIGICVCGVVYTVSTLFTYLFWFDPFEAAVLASLSRYLNTCLTAIFVILAAAAGAAMCGRRLWQKALCGVLCIAVWLLSASPSPVPILTDILHAPTASARSQNFQRPYTQAADTIASMYPDTTGELPVFVVAQHDYGMTTLRLDYSLSPSWLPEHTSSIGSPYEEDDRWTMFHTPETLSQKLTDEQFEYVYLYEVDDKFRAEFGTLFPNPEEIQNQSLFRIEPAENGLIRLIKV